jgi:hypothetical protein
MPPIAMLLPLLGDVLDRVLPDDKSKEQAKLEVARMALEGRTIELNAIRDVDVAQAQVNAAEASTGGFASTWRPAAGWVTVLALGYQFLIYPFLVWYSTTNNIPAPPSVMNDDLWVLVFGMLGLGAYRTFEKVKR